MRAGAVRRVLGHRPIPPSDQESFMPSRTAVPANRALIALASFLLAGAASAASVRTFVASTGLDANAGVNCSLAAPCRTFAAALAVTTAGGEVVALDTAGYGPVTITQAVTIEAPAGVYAGVAVPASGIGVLINAPGQSVRLDGLRIVGAANATDGIRIGGAGTVTVRNTGIANLAYGVRVIDGSLVMENCTISTTTQSGIITEPTMSAPDVLLESVVINKAATAGISATGLTSLTIRNSAILNSGWVGLGAGAEYLDCLLYTSPSPRDGLLSRMPSSA